MRFNKQFFKQVAFGQVRCFTMQVFNTQPVLFHQYYLCHLLLFKKWSFTLVWKPNPPLRSVCCTHLRAHADAVIICSTHEALVLKAPLSTWSVKSDSCYNVPLLCSARCMKPMLWSSADHALAQVRPRQIFTRTLSKKWSQSRALSLKIFLGGGVRAINRQTAIFVADSPR